MRRLLPSCLLVALVCVSPAAAAERAPGPAPPFAPGELIVRFEPGVSGSERAEVRREHDATVEEALALPHAQLLELQPGASVTRAVASFERDPRVSYAEPNYVFRASTNDPLFGQLWGLDSLADADVDAPEAWALDTAPAPVTVAVADTGVAPAHPDLRGQFVAGQDFVGADLATDDLDGHGTHVAGTIAALHDNAAGIAGVARQVRVMPLRVLDAGGSGEAADIADAFAHADAQGVPIVNASFGATGPSNAVRQTIEAADGTLFVAAAGNTGDSNDDADGGEFPCNYTASNVLCVAASDRADERASFSNWGATSVDIAAPGVETWSTYPGFEQVFEERFDSGLGGWSEGTVVAGLDVPGDTPWALSSAPGHFTPDPGDGPPGLAASPTAPYAGASETFIQTTAPVPLAASGCKLVFDLRMAVDSGGGDVFTVEARAAPAGPWTTLFSRAKDTSWETFTADFRPYHGPGDLYGQNVHLRLRFKTDALNLSGGPFEGVFVDWLEIECLDPPADGYRELNGTSMAAPHVSGAAALVLAGDPALLAAAPADRTSQLKARLLATGDASACWAGLTTSGRRLNLGRALGAPEASLGSGPTAASCPSQSGTTQTPVPPPAPPGTGTGTGTGTQTEQPAGGGTTGATTDRSAPVASFRVLGARLRTIAARGLRARVRCSEACSIASELLLDPSVSRRLGLIPNGRARYVLVGRGRARTTRAGRKTVVTRVLRVARPALASARRVPATLRLTIRDRHGNERTLRKRLTLRR